MSWIKTNYHIAALGGSVLVLAGLGYLGYSGSQSVSESLTIPSSRPGDTTTSEGGPLADSVNAMLTGANPVAQRKTSEERPVNLFTSVDLYIRPGDPNQLVDILKQEPLHPPIENQWWVDHQIDPTYSDSPFQDADKDGFTNLEEYKGGTDPNDPADVGDLVTKLEVSAVESDIWRLDFKANPSAGPQFDLLYRAFGSRRTATNKIPSGSGVDAGAIFFEDDPGKGRFKLVDIITKKEQTSIGMQDRPYANLEDQRPNKLGKKYQIPLKPSDEEKRDALSADHTVVFRLNAVGEEDNLFKVEENGTFALPSGGDEKSYQLTKVEVDASRDPVSVTVEYGPESDRKSITIPVPSAPSSN